MAFKFGMKELQRLKQEKKAEEDSGGSTPTVSMSPITQNVGQYHLAIRGVDQATFNNVWAVGAAGARGGAGFDLNPGGIGMVAWMQRVTASVCFVRNSFGSEIVVILRNANGAVAEHYSCGHGRQTLRKINNVGNAQMISWIDIRQDASNVSVAELIRAVITNDQILAA